MLAPVRRVEAICARHGVPPGAAALQFSMRDPRIAATICGVTRPERVQETLEWAAWPIGEEAWDGAHGAALRHRRPGGDAGLQAGVSRRAARALERRGSRGRGARRRRRGGLADSRRGPLTEALAAPMAGASDASSLSPERSGSEDG